MQSQRFVVLRHEPGTAGPRELHWDLLLEFGDHLRAWSLASEPTRGAAISAMQLPDHRKHYLTYEGPVSDERGVVSQFDSGTYEIVSESLGQLVIQLVGRRMSGRATIAIDADQRCSVEFTSR